MGNARSPTAFKRLIERLQWLRHLAVQHDQSQHRIGPKQPRIGPSPAGLILFFRVDEFFRS